MFHSQLSCWEIPSCKVIHVAVHSISYWVIEAGELEPSTSSLHVAVFPLVYVLHVVVHLTSVGLQHLGWEGRN